MIFHDLGIEIVSFPKNGGSFHSLLYYQRVSKKIWMVTMGFPKFSYYTAMLTYDWARYGIFFSGEDMFQKYETKQVHPWRRNWFYP